MVTETRTIEVPVEVFKPLPASITNPVAYPAALPDEFTVDDLFDLVFGLYDALDQANRDKEDAAELTQPSGASGPLPQ